MPSPMTYPRSVQATNCFAWPGSKFRKLLIPKKVQQPEGIGAVHVQVRHVVGEVKQANGLPPRPLLVLPGGELRGDHGVDAPAGLVVVEVVRDIGDGGTISCKVRGRAAILLSRAVRSVRPL